MMKLTIPIGVALLANITTANADIYNYSCKVGKKTYPLVVDDVRSTLDWQGVKHQGITNANEDEIRCARAGWHIEDGEASFNFCTSTKGGGAIEQLDQVKALCDLQNTLAEPPPPPKPLSERERVAALLAGKPSTPDPASNWVDKFMAQQKAIDNANKSRDQPEPAPPVEELSCNSDTVKRILVDGTVNKTASESAKLAQLFKNNAELYADLVQVSRWKGTVVNVREMNRAPGKVSCAAEFEWQNMPSKQAMANVGVILLAQGIEDKSCIKINYQVQPLLDKLGQIYVSWRCNDG